ncbi:hypothetical protein [Jannaschia marina]|uniref:hypothetical protein n=1 Tax=Jannaschia marina TaxID=2741674 RepID=UPI0015CE5885|nr:hypothetical protein [Jannaschia marina]
MDLRARIEASFARQGMMRTLGAELLSVEAGEVRVGADVTEGSAQQQGAGHAQVATALGTMVPVRA